VGSALIPLLIGVALGDLLHGLPIDSSHEYTGNFIDLLTPYGLWTGATLVILSLLHGATFLMLKTTGDVRARSAVAARILVWPSLGAILGFMIWTRTISGEHFPSTLIVLGVLAVLGAGYLIHARQEGLAFAASAVSIGVCLVSIFVALYPNVLVSTTNSAYNLTVSNSASGHYALVVMTVVALLVSPVVLLYQGWSFHVFRARVGAGPQKPPEAPPAEPAAAPADS
jgi:cytochrome d ubiquinol oxidase subunit II